jgi:hypothetical protein
MADVKARGLPTSQSFDPNTDLIMVVKGDASGPRSGPFLIPGLNVSVGSAATGGGGGTGGGTVVSGITKVFGRTGPEITAAANDYRADQVSFDPTESGLAADNVEMAINAVVALRGALPVPETDGDILTVTGGEWSAQPPAVESVFGNSGAIVAAAGQYHADLISQVKTVGEDPNVATTNRFVTAAQIAKLTSLDLTRQLPDPAGATVGHVLTVVDSGGNSWAAAAPTGGTGGSSSGFVLTATALLRPDPSAPPSWVYSGGTGYWDFAASGTQPVYFEIDYWPGGAAVTMNLAVTCAATSGSVRFSAQVAAVTPDTTELWDRSFASAVTGTITVPDNVKKMKRVPIALTGLDGVAVGDWVRVKFWRDNTVGSNAAGAVQVRGVDVRFLSA